MNPRQLAKGAPYHLATEIEECPLWRFWVVLLDNGTEIYQTEPDGDLDDPNPWIRLKQFCKDQDCKIVSMSFARKDFNPVAQINLSPTADGYFYSRRVRKLMAANPGWSGLGDAAQGFGELHGTRLTIHWVDDESGRVTTEHREVVKNGKHDGSVGLIRN